MKGICFFAMAAAILFTGCKDGTMLPERNEIEDMEMVRVVAIDKSKEPGLLKVTVASKREEDGGGGTAEDRAKAKAIILTSEEKTVFAAGRQLQTYTDRQIFWGHAEFYLLGEEAAREDFTKYIDFLSRDHELRLNSLVYVVQGEASQVLDKNNRSDYFIADRLHAFSKNVGLLSVSGKIKLLEVMGELDCNDTFSLAVPAVAWMERTGGNKESGAQTQENLDISGYGIVKNFKLIGFMDRTLSRGYNFIQNEIHSGAIDVVDPWGKTVAMEIIGSKTNISPKLAGGKLESVVIRAELETNIIEVHTRENIFKEGILHYLEKQQSEKIKSEMEKCVQYAQTHEADFLGVGKKLSLSHPTLWEGMKEQWPEIFGKIPITIEVETKINRTYVIREANGYKAGGSQ